MLKRFFIFYKNKGFSNINISSFKLIVVLYAYSGKPYTWFYALQYIFLNKRGIFIFYKRCFCSMFYVLCSMFYVLCSMFYVLCSMFYVLCSMFYVLCSMLYGLCSIFYVLWSICSMFYDLCSFFYVLCSMFYVLCFMFYVQYFVWLSFIFNDKLYQMFFFCSCVNVYNFFSSHS